MKLTVVEYSPDSDRWYTTEYIPSNSRDILIYSPEFGTSIGHYSFYEDGGLFSDLLRVRENINVLYWREMPRYVPNQSCIQ